jgi:hypothetical protein
MTNQVPDAKAVETQTRDTQLPTIVETEVPLVEKPSRRDRGLERLFGTIHKHIAEQGKFNQEITSRLEKGSLANEVARDPKPTLETSDNDPEKMGTELAAWTLRDNERKARKKEVDRPRPSSGPLPPEVRAQSLSEKIGVDEEVALDFIEQQEDAKEIYSDFDKVVNNRAIPSSAILNKCIVESKQGAKIQYLLGKDQVRAEAIAKLTRTKDVLIALEKLEEEVSSTDSDAEEEITPIAPVGGSRSQTRKPLEKMNSEDYFAVRQAELNKTRRFN